MIKHHTIWNIMRKYTPRQIDNRCLPLISNFLESIIKDIVIESESILRIHTKNNHRLSSDCIKAIINNKSDTILPNQAGGVLKETQIDNLHLPEVV